MFGFRIPDIQIPIQHLSEKEICKQAWQMFCFGSKALDKLAKWKPEIHPKTRQIKAQTFQSVLSCASKRPRIVPRPHRTPKVEAPSMTNGKSGTTNNNIFFPKCQES